MISICYVTARKDCRIHWFLDSLNRQCRGDYSELRIIVVDFYLQPHLDWTAADVAFRQAEFYSIHRAPAGHFIHVPPKPCVWSGPHRLTKTDYFSAASTRNTALCLCPDPYLVYADDLSVLGPRWLERVRDAAANNRVVCGAFRKVKNIAVLNGELKSFEPHTNEHGTDIGIDTRWYAGRDDQPVRCAPNWTYGCSLALPTEALLKVNGWPEIADSSGVAGEDSFVGIAMAANGHEIWYDRQMLTYEAEDLHGQGRVLKRVDKGNIGTTDSKSHALVRILEKQRRFDDYYGNGGMAGLRARVLGGEPFPVLQHPLHDWYSGELLVDL